MRLEKNKSSCKFKLTIDQLGWSVCRLNAPTSPSPAPTEGALGEGGTRVDPLGGGTGYAARRKLQRLGRCGGARLLMRRTLFLSQPVLGCIMQFLLVRSACANIEWERCEELLHACHHSRMSTTFGRNLATHPPVHNGS